MEEPTYRQQDEGQQLPTTDLRGGQSEQPMPTTDPRGEEPEQRLTTSDMASRAGERTEGDPRAGGGENRALFPEADASALRERWRDVQTAFVDEPRRAVEDADSLVADLMQKLAETFANERSSLEAQWDRSGDVSTEEMRVALQRYRSFFDRLLSA